MAEVDDRGGTRLVELREEPPLLLRRTRSYDGSAVVHLVGGAAGPLGGDDLELEIEVRPQAALCLRTVAASVALPARSRRPSRFAVSATVGAGGILHWLPEQTVAAAGCRHTTSATVAVAAGGSVLWRDELVCGRHAERPGDASVHTSVDYAGTPLLRQRIDVGPGADGWDGPAVLGGAPATGSLLGVRPGSRPVAPVVLGPTAVRVPLAGPGWLVTATAADAHTLRTQLTEPAVPDAEHRPDGRRTGRGRG
ncbi:urease accessory protein UreD [Micromonospora zhanjiangensis]|uniref:Urease accessory protein UreD n=1 Tax=Micromonospora zhanjiangensis TaxID=1522057 RepID=A0ABV8KWS5_9ACTN